MTSNSSAIKRLKAFEADADAAIEALPILQLPARAVLAGLHYLVFTGFHTGQLTGAEEAGIGETIIQRISNSLPLLRELPAEPYGESAEDAITAFTEALEDESTLIELLSYLHFSEFMPEVHRGYYAVESDGVDRFELCHKDLEFADCQAKDITLSEIALPFPIERTTRIESDFGRLAEMAPEIDWRFAAKYVTINAYKYRHGMAEADLITDVSIQHIFGFDRTRFIFIRSVVLAFAEFCDKLATTMHALVLAKKLPEDRMAEALEWVSVNLNEDFLVGFFAVGAGAEPAEVARFLEYYSIDFTQAPASDLGGDGFFPPFARFENGLLFSPLMVMAFLQVRNAVFGFSKKDKKTFDNDVSCELEPVLLDQACELLRRGGDWIALADIKFPGGQIDLLVTAPDDDAVLLIQAKGTMPPQGARLTERLASRVREGIEQIEKFEELPEDAQRGVIEQALKRKVGKVNVSHALMTRSCFGAVEVFAADFPHVRLTAPLLSLSLEYHRDAKLPTTVAALTQAIADTEVRIFERSGYHWEQGEMVLAGAMIKMPLLKWATGSLETLRQDWWNSTIRPKLDATKQPSTPSPSHP